MEVDAAGTVTNLGASETDDKNSNAFFSGEACVASDKQAQGTPGRVKGVLLRERRVVGGEPTLGPQISRQPSCPSTRTSKGSKVGVCPRTSLALSRTRRLRQRPVADAIRNRVNATDGQEQSHTDW